MNSLVLAGWLTLLAMVSCQQYNRFGQAYPYQGNNQAWNGGQDYDYNQNQQQGYGQGQQGYGQDQQGYGQGQQGFGQGQQGGQFNQVSTPCPQFSLAHTYVADPQDCHKFYRCGLHRMNPEVFYCPNNQVFDRDTHVCRSEIDGECNL